MRDHTRLRAFHLADELAPLIYKVSTGLPKDEIYGLSSQMRRSAVSVPSNIIEGSARESQTEYLRFLEIAFGSLKESHYQFTTASRLGYVCTPDSAACELQFTGTEKVLSALMRSLRKKPNSPTAEQPNSPTAFSNIYQTPNDLK